MGRAMASVKAQVFVQPRPTIEQRPRPVHRTAGRCFAMAVAALVESSRTGSGIRPRR
jgi:hypothetical protein